MKLVSYIQNGKVNLGALENDLIYDIHKLDSQIACNRANQ